MTGFTAVWTAFLALTFLGVSAYAGPVATAQAIPSPAAPAQSIPKDGANAPLPNGVGPAAAGLGAAGAPGAPAAPIKPYRTFITIQRFAIENNGEPKNPVSNVRLELAFPNGNKLDLPGNAQFWAIGNGQMQEINQTYELPYAAIAKDGFNFQIQIVRKGSKFLPCAFEVTQLSQFNRGYVCHTDIGWQQSQKLAEDKIDREGVQVRVFTDLNSEPKEIPTSAMALR